MADDFESALYDLYRLFRGDDTGVLEHLGLPMDATWEQFRAQYSGEPLSTAVRVHKEAMRHEPFAAKHRAEIAAAGITHETWLHDIAEDIARAQEAVMKHNRPEDRQALADLRDMFREGLKAGKTTQH